MTSYKNAQLFEAFKRREKKKFFYMLDMGANPEQSLDQAKPWTIFALMCKEPGAAEYLIKCIEHKTDPNRKNPVNGQYPIHIAVQHLVVENIKVLLEADADCANQTLNFDKTPLHLVAELVNNSNLPTIFEIIRLFSEYGGDFSWPARISENQTPFQMFLEKFATLEDKRNCSKIIRYLIEKYPRITMFQRKKCTYLMRQNFGELLDEYQVIDNWKEETSRDTDWKAQLVKLLEEYEPEFLVKFDIQKRSNINELRVAVAENELIFLTITHDKFESFVAIYGLNFDVIDIGKVAREILTLNRCRILKYFLDHDSVARIDPKWMLIIMQQMKDTKINIDPHTLKCFNILLNHEKYDVNEQIPDAFNETALHYACGTSEYATLELLRSGASLGIRDNDGHMAVQYIDKNALEKFFDSCISTCIPEDQSDIDYYMVIDYSFLKAPKEMPPIEYMAGAKDLQSLIEHPVIASFLFLKWLRLSNIFYLNLIYFSISTISFSIYLIFCYVGQTHQDATYNVWLQILQFLTYWSFIMFSIKEVSQFIGSPTSYLKSIEDYFEIGLMCLMGVVLFIPLDDQEIRRAITAVLFLAFAIEWTLIYSALPLFSGSNYIVMLKKVAVNFLRTLAFYSIILLAFALSFYTLLNTSEENAGKTTESHKLYQSTMFSALFDVILMLTGDFGTISEELSNIIIGRIFLLVFVLSMTIVMMNLLLGLTVSDTAAIQNEAEWYKWCERAKLLGKYERMAWNCLRWIKYCGLENKFLTIVQLMPDFLPSNKIKIEISSFDSNKWIYIPKPMKSDGDEKVEKGDKLHRDIESDPFPLLGVKKKALNRSYFGCYTNPVKMEEQIIENGLKVLELNLELKSKRESEKQEKVYREEIRQTLDHLKNNQGLKIDNIQQKLDQLLILMQNGATACNPKIKI